DSLEEIRTLCEWILGHAGPDVPLHFTAFHPDFRMRDRPRTPVETLLAAYDIAKSQGLRHVYVGNVDDQRHQSTYCPNCRGLLIERNWYALGKYHLDGNRCAHCGTVVSGHFASTPGNWGRQRRPVDIADYRSKSEPAAIQQTTVNSQQPMSGSRQSPETSSAESADRPQFSTEQRAALHAFACHVISARTAGSTRPDPPPELDALKSLPVQGAFVTAKIQGELRACCGTFGPRVTLCDALIQAAWRTAGDDPRFPPIAAMELSQLTIDITLLFEFRVLNSTGMQRIADVEIGRHGLLIQKDQRQGLLLPSVAVEHNLDAEQFLDLVCRKAGLEQTAWKASAARLSTFEGLLWGGPFAAGSPQPAEPPIPHTSLQALVQHALQNLSAVSRGATPNPYATQLVDRAVAGLILTVGRPDQTQAQQFGKLGLRSGLPLQSTLFQLTQSAADWLRSHPQTDPVASTHDASVPKVQLDLCILTDATLHSHRDDFAELHTAQRGLGFQDASDWAVFFDPGQNATDLVDALRASPGWRSEAAASVFSVAVSSTSDPLFFRQAPRAIATGNRRPAAVAGQFYPGDAHELSEAVNQLMTKAESGPVAPWPALMLPHAGYRYSGGLAATTLKRVQIPESVIIIGPKHTRNGVNWAVSPHDAWSLPGREIAADTSLAKLLTDRIPGLQLDAAAHASEHAIEVELPLIAHLAPTARVVGIVIGQADLAECLKLGEQLAEVLRTLPRQPLLVISSDMNHFADDSTTRRLDSLALEALETRDPSRVLSTVRQHQISMCGVLPATIVLETLRQLGQLSVSERTGYATSADASGQRERVVGYAGMLFG
ncbi:MAG: AmmeMemoRadiSam system protein B, partial [Planctomycetaceae bacterium]